MWETERNPIVVSSLVRSYLRRWHWFLGTVLVVMLGTFVFIRTSPRVYEAMARVLVETPRPSPMGGLSFLFGGAGASDIATQVEVLKTHQLIEGVRHKLGYSEPYRQFSRRFRITSIRGANVVEIRARADTPPQSAELANSLMQAYLDFATNLYKNNPNSVSAQLAEEVRQTEKRMAENQQQIVRFLEEKKLVNPDEELKIRLGQHAKLMDQYFTLQAEERSTLKLIEALRAELKSQKPTRIDSQTFAIPSDVQQLTTKLAELEIERDRLLEEYRPDAPEVKSKEAEIASTRQKLDEAVKKTVNGQLAVLSKEEATNPIWQGLLQTLLQEQANLATTRTKLAHMKAQLHQSEQQLRSAPEVLGQYQALLRQQQALQNIWSQKLQSFEQFRTQEQIGINPLPLETAVAPDRPIYPRPALFTAIGLLLGLLLGSVVVFWREMVDRRITDRWTAERWLNAPVLLELPASQPTPGAVLPLFYALKALGSGQEWHNVLIVPLQPSERAAEWVDLIQTSTEQLSNGEVQVDDPKLPSPVDAMPHANGFMMRYSQSLMDRGALAAFMQAERLILLVPVGVTLTPELQDTIQWLQPRLLGVVLIHPDSGARR